jgi:hypothetical protein
VLVDIDPIERKRRQSPFVRGLEQAPELIGAVPFERRYPALAQQPPEPGLYAPGLTEFAVVDGRRFDVAMVPVEHGWGGARSGGLTRGGRARHRYRLTRLLACTSLA